MGRRYGFVKPRLIVFFRAVDAIGDRLMRSRPPIEPPRRLLVINLAHIGDVLLTTPTIRRLRQVFPQAHLTALVGPWSAPILQGNPDLDAVSTFAASWFDRSRRAYFRPGEFRRLVDRLRQGHFDTVVNVKSFFQEHLAVALAGIPRRIGYGLYGGGFLLTDEVPYPFSGHAVDRNLGLIESAGLVPAAGAAPLVLPVTPADRQEAAAALDAVRDSERRLVAIHVGAAEPERRWGADRFAAVAEALAGYGAAVVLVGGADDLAEARRTTARCHRSKPLVLAGRLGLRATAAAIAVSDLFLGNDSAPAHLAAAVGTPAVVIFAAHTTAEQWGPRPGQGLALGHLSQSTGWSVPTVDEVVAACHHWLEAPRASAGAAAGGDPA